MSMRKFTIIYKKKENNDTFIIRARPTDKEAIAQFSAGQYVMILDTASSYPTELHPFSIASSPANPDYLEFSIRAVGHWTTEFVKKEPGDDIDISEPEGSFIWHNNITSAVFLIGGLGISPVMSMLRYIQDTGQNPELVLIYGNRDLESVVYKEELGKLQKMLNLKVVDVFSHLPENHPWTALPAGRQGYRGFITEKVITDVTNTAGNPVFFVIGPPVFIDHMHKELHALHIPEENFRTEHLMKR
jgi:ferredoxin-NADP reductase